MATSYMNPTDRYRHVGDVGGPHKVQLPERYVTDEVRVDRVLGMWTPRVGPGNRALQAHHVGSSARPRPTPGAILCARLKTPRAVHPALGVCWRCPGRRLLRRPALLTHDGLYPAGVMQSPPCRATSA
jgi:hypothetical protein